MPDSTHKTFLNHSVFIFLIRFFPSLAFLLVTIYFSRNLSQHDYGVYQGIWTPYYLFSAIACLGIQAWVITYTPQKLVYFFGKLFARSAIVIPFWIAIVAAIFGCLEGGEDVQAFTAAAFMFLLSANVIAEAFLIVFTRFRFLAVLNVAYSLVFVWLHWRKLHMIGDFESLFMGMAVLALVKLTLSIVVIVRAVRQTYEEQRADSSNAEDVANIRSLWIHLGFYDLVQIAVLWIDKIVMNIVLPKELFAVYYNGSQNIPFLPLILSSAASAGLIQLSGVHNKANKEQNALKLMLQTGRILSCIVFPLFFFLMFFRYELFNVVLTNKYEASVPMFLAGLFALPVRAYSFTTILQHYHKGKIINIGSVGDFVLACLLMYPLYLWLGLPGVVLSFVIPTYLQAIFYTYHSAKILGKPAYEILPLKNWGIKLIVFSIVFIGLHYLLSSNFRPQIVLILGGISLGAVILTTLKLEIKNNRKHGHE